MTNTYKNLSENESTMDSSTTHQSSVIYVPSTGLSIKDWLASQAAAFPVSHIPWPAEDKENTTQETFGQPSESALAWWEAPMSCWRTYQGCLFPLTDDPRDMLQPLLGSFPNSGMTVDGVLYLLPPLVPRTSGGDGGASAWQTPTVTSIPPRSEEALVKKKESRNKSGRHTVPPGTLEEQVAYSPNEGDAPIWDMLKAQPLWATPTTQDFPHKDMVVNENNRRESKTTDTNRGLNLQDQVSMWPTPNTRDTRRGCNQKQLATEVDKWPTPTEDDSSNVNPKPNRRPGLVSRVNDKEKEKWPTPMARDHIDALHHKPNRQEHLLDRVRKGMWPTPNAHEDRAENYSEETSERHYLEGRQIHLSQAARMWPTPSASEGTKSGTRANYGQIRLSNHPDIVGYPDRDKMNKSQLGDKTRAFPTPMASDGDTSGKDTQRYQSLDVHIREHQTSEKAGGQLNPSWVAWLMGLPPGWESLEPVSREDYDAWLELHMSGMWWAEERGLPRVGHNIPDRVNRLKACGNGIVPSCVAAFLRLIYS